MLGNIKSLIGALVIVLIFRAFVVEAYRIPSGSMTPTLLVGDWLFVNKLGYGPHVPFTKWHLPGYRAPRRRDVVVFESPPQHDNGDDSTPILVKRLWGTPGDTLYMRSGTLYINGTAYPQGPEFAPYDSTDPTETRPSDTHPDFAWQTVVGLRASRFGPAPAVPTHDNWGPVVVPPQSYFMMGDNRYNSKDSRYWGFAPRDNLRGQPLFVYYSYDTERGVDWFRAITEIRWRRLGHWIR